MLVELYFYEARRKVRVQETERLKCFSRVWIEEDSLENSQPAALVHSSVFRSGLYLMQVYAFYYSEYIQAASRAVVFLMIQREKKPLSLIHMVETAWI
jgi:hypothetical protein